VKLSATLRRLGQGGLALAAASALSACISVAHDGYHDYDYYGDDAYSHPYGRYDDAHYPGMYFDSGLGLYHVHGHPYHYFHDGYFYRWNTGYWHRSRHWGSHWEPWDARRLPRVVHHGHERIFRERHHRGGQRPAVGHERTRGRFGNRGIETGPRDGQRGEAHHGRPDERRARRHEQREHRRSETGWIGAGPRSHGRPARAEHRRERPENTRHREQQRPDLAERPQRAHSRERGETRQRGEARQRGETRQRGEARQRGESRTGQQRGRGQWQHRNRR